MSLSFDEDIAYHRDAKLATVVWVQYTGDTEDIEDEYLLMQRRKEPGKGYTIGLGGKIERQDFDQTDSPPDSDDIEEAAYNTAIREVDEEADVNLTRLNRLGLVNYRTEVPDRDDPWMIYHFHAETEETPDDYQHEEGDLTWQSDEDLTDLEFGLGHGAFIENLREMTPFIASVTETDDGRYEIDKTDLPYDIMQE